MFNHLMDTKHKLYNADLACKVVGQYRMPKKCICGKNVHPALKCKVNDNRRMSYAKFKSKAKKGFSDIC